MKDEIFQIIVGLLYQVFVTHLKKRNPKEDKQALEEALEQAMGFMSEHHQNQISQVYPTEIPLIIRRSDKIWNAFVIRVNQEHDLILDSEAFKKLLSHDQTDSVLWSEHPLQTNLPTNITLH